MSSAGIRHQAADSSRNALQLCHVVCWLKFVCHFDKVELFSVPSRDSSRQFNNPSQAAVLYLFPERLHLKRGAGSALCVFDCFFTFCNSFYTTLLSLTFIFRLVESLVLNHTALIWHLLFMPFGFCIFISFTFWHLVMGCAQQRNTQNTKNEGATHH